MPRLRFPFTLLPLVLLWAAFAEFVWFTAAQLPERVATHFVASGRPDGWMTRAEHVRFTLGAGLIVPAFITGLFATMRHFGDRWMNLPNKDYWLAPERRPQTFDFVERQGAWLASLLILFFAGIHYSILAANARQPVALAPAVVVWIAGPFLAATLLWAALFLVHFYRRPA